MTEQAVAVYTGETFDHESLSAPLKEQDIKVRKGPGGMQLKYIKGSHAIETANRIFGFGRWGYKVVARSHEVMHDEKKDTNVEYYTCDIDLSVVGCAFSFPGDGMGIVLFNTPEGHEKARKEATTDALKRALRHYGDQFGLSLYDEDNYIEGVNGEIKQVKDVHQNGNKQPQAKKTVDAANSAPSTPLDQAKKDAYKAGWITGKTIEQLKASWDEQMIQMFGSLLPEAELSKSHNLARINGKIEEHKRQKTAASVGGK